MTVSRRNLPASRIPCGLGRNRRRPRAMVLLEVVLAMMLFFGGALVILAGLNSSLLGIQRVQMEARAADLAVTLLSEVQMGMVQLVSDGPSSYEDPALADWTWEISIEPFEEQQLELELPEFQRVEVTIRNQSTGYATSLAILITDELVAEDTEAESGEGITIPGAGDGGGL